MEKLKFDNEYYLGDNIEKLLVKFKRKLTKQDGLEFEIINPSTGTEKQKIYFELRENGKRKNGISIFSPRQDDRIQVSSINMISDFLDNINPFKNEEFFIKFLYISC